MSATAEITTKTVNNVIAVPLQAVIEKEAGGNAVTDASRQCSPQPMDKPKPIKGVYVLDGNKVEICRGADRHNRRVGYRDHVGLQADQKVITGPSRVLNTLKEGAVVKKQEKKEGENANKS